MTTGSQEQGVLHPLRRHLRDLRQMLGPLEKELGLTPESRIRLGHSKADYDDALDKFNKRWSSDADLEVIDD